LPSAPLPLPTVPGYEVLGELGRGGMGVVYKARQLKLNRTVALKMILAGPLAGPEHRARFLSEAESVARLRHPNIVQIYEIGEALGRPFFSMEFMEGSSLDRRLDGTPLPPRAAVQLVETLARAVHHAHEQGVIHRDLKPANVLLAISDASQKRQAEQRFCEASLNDCVPKITDFGLAKRLDEVGRTLTAVLGTPAYMAPEQAAGRTKEVGPAADIWALGVILYELLTGRAPFKADSAMETVAMASADDPVSPKRLNRKVPRDLETICLKCLRKEPARRYASAEALAEDLAAFREGRPIRARPAGVLERAVKWAKRRPALAAALAVTMLALAGLGAGGFVLAVERLERDRARLERDRMEDARLQAENERQTRRQVQAALGREQQALGRERQAKAGLEQEQEKTQRLLAGSRVSEAYNAWQQHNLELAGKILDGCPAPTRALWDWRFVKGLTSGSLMTLYDHLGEVNTI
jgi:tRNA A-37 threonylcarbamoyl transferase component Bud32